MIELVLAAERLVRAGDLDHAERLYLQVADADPQNAIAVAGLARVALARGDRVAAETLARRALAIDPEDVAAGRLIAALEAEAAVVDVGHPPAEPEGQAGAVIEAAASATSAAAEPAPSAAAEPAPPAAAEPAPSAAEPFLPVAEPFPPVAAPAALVAEPSPPARLSLLRRIVGFFRR